MARRYFPDIDMPSPQLHFSSNSNPIPIDPSYHFYKRIYSHLLNEDQSFDQQNMSTYRNRMFGQNISRYQYSRAHHYHFELDQFPRVPKQPSYAIDLNNSFGSTFSQDHKEIKGSRLDSIINRTCFTCPMRRQEDQKNIEGSTKNVCHSYLFQLQDKKVYLDRLLINCKKVLKKLDYYIESGKITSFLLLRRQRDLSQLFDPNINIALKRRILTDKIQNYTLAKQFNNKKLQMQDSIYFHSSLNQKLHDQIKTFKKQYQIQKLRPLLYNSYIYRLQFIKERNIDLEPFLQRMFRYYRNEQFCIGYDARNMIRNRYADKLIGEIENTPYVQFPIQILYFGSDQLFQLVQDIVITKMNGCRGANNYKSNSIFHKLFNRTLQQTRKIQTILMRETALRQTIKVVAQMKQFYSHQQRSQRQKHPNLQERLNIQELDLQIQTEPISIFKQIDMIQISGEQFIMIIFIHWICESFKSILPFALTNPSFISIISSQFFKLLDYPLVNIANNKQFGVLSNLLQILCDYIHNTTQFSFYQFKLFFEYDVQTRVGIIWRQEMEEQEQEQIASQSQQNAKKKSVYSSSDQDDEDLLDKLCKKIKQQ